MTKVYEYKVEIVKSPHNATDEEIDKNILKKLNHEGKDGWECIYMTGHVMEYHEGHNDQMKMEIFLKRAKKPIDYLESYPPNVQAELGGHKSELKQTVSIPHLR